MDDNTNKQARSTHLNETHEHVPNGDEINCTTDGVTESDNQDELDTHLPNSNTEDTNTACINGELSKTANDSEFEKSVSEISVDYETDNMYLDDECVELFYETSYVVDGDKPIENEPDDGQPSESITMSVERLSAVQPMQTEIVHEENQQNKMSANERPTMKSNEKQSNFLLNSTEKYFALSVLGSLQRLAPEQRPTAKLSILNYLSRLEFGDDDACLD